MVTRYVLLLVALAIAFTLTGFPARVLHSYEVNQRARQLEEQLAALKRENELLQQELAWRRTDEYVRTTAKENLGLVQPGEEVVLLPLDRSSRDEALDTDMAGLETAGTRSLPAEDGYDPEWGYLPKWINLLRHPAR
jgi:cell division protein FtsB